MNVRPESAIALLTVFSRLEFAINEIGNFLRPRGTQPSIDWSAFYEAVEEQVKNGTPLAIQVQDRNTLLGIGIGGPPYRMRVIEIDGGRKVRFAPEPLAEPTELRCVLEAAVRVRNNLVHGGKDRASQKRGDAHDQLVVDAAIRVIEAASHVRPDISTLCWS